MPLNRVSAFAAALFLLCGGAVTSFAQSNWDVKRTVPIGGEGGMDYVTADGPNHRLFATRSTHTLAIDTETGKVLGDIPGTKNAHGVAIVPKLNRGFVTDGGNGVIVIFDLNTYAVLGKLAALPDADGIIYDEKTDRVLVSAGDSNALITFKPEIDPANGKIDPPIKLPGSPEFLAADGEGKAYINIEDKDVVAVVDLEAGKVVAQWPVTPGGHPVGLSIDRNSHRLFIGCRDPQKLIVMNTRSGKVEGALPIGAGVDATAYYKGHAFASCRDGSLVVAGEDAGTFKILQSVKTPFGAKTLAVDGVTGKIYLPTAQFETGANGKPKAKPGSFMIVEVAAQ